MRENRTYGSVRVRGRNAVFLLDPRDADPSPALCGRWLKALRGRSGAVGLEPLPTLAKDHNRSKDRGDKLESIGLEQTRKTADALFTGKSAASA